MGNEHAFPLLSICIPTRNRGNSLLKTLQSIVSQKPFQETRDVEIVISDNCSDDNTWVIADEFSRLYPEKIKIFRSSEDVGASENIKKCLSLASSAFLKLNNDTLLWAEGAVDGVLKIIRATYDGRPLLFFLNGNPCCSEPLKVFHGLNEFVQNCSFNITWIGAFGIWRDDYESLPDFCRCADLLLPQTDVLLRLLSTGRQGVIINVPYFFSISPGRKSGYNIAEVFGKNYLSLLKGYLSSDLLDRQVFEAEKKTLLLNHIIPYYFNVREQNDFEATGFFRHLEDYWGDRYFYDEIEQFLVSPATLPKPNVPPVAAPPPLARPSPEDLGTLWRQRNSHNETYLTRGVDISRISVGRRTYGPLAVWTWNQDNEHLTIGHFCSIADGVKFLLGGNHPFKGVSTFPFKVKYFGAQEEAFTKGPITIKDDVWIGADAIILSGVTIGQGAIIAAGSVVTKSIPPYSIVGGNPARILKNRFEPEVVQELLKFDFATLSDEEIQKSQEFLYEEITVENVRALVSRIKPSREGNSRCG
jgi:acetyltransferase-like isoleucine patch superfamily enzyme/glycosyltransferase involved in cell wall biosynthesis